MTSCKLKEIENILWIATMLFGVTELVVYLIYPIFGRIIAGISLVVIAPMFIMYLYKSRNYKQNSSNYDTNRTKQGYNIESQQCHANENQDYSNSKKPISFIIRIFRNSAPPKEK
jgi:hypothetical protein